MKTEKNTLSEMEQQIIEESVPEWEDFFLPTTEETDNIADQSDSEESQEKPPTG